MWPQLRSGCLWRDLRGNERCQWWFLMTVNTYAVIIGRSGGGGVSHKPKTQLKGGQCESGRQAGSDRAQAVPRQTKTRDRFGRPRPVAREQEGALHYTTLQGEYSSMDDPAESHCEMIRSVAWSEFLFSLDCLLCRLSSSHSFSAKCDDRFFWVLDWVFLLDRLMVYRSVYLHQCLLRLKMVALDNVDCMYQYNLDRTVVFLSSRGAWWLRSWSHGWNSLIQIVWIHYLCGYTTHQGNQM